MTNLRSELRWIRILLMVVAVPIIVIILKTLQDIFIPLVFAVFLSFVFAPMIQALSKRKVHMSIILVLLMASILLFFVLVGGIIYMAADSFLLEYPAYQQKLTVLADSTLAGLRDIAARVDEALLGVFMIDASNLISESGFSLTKFISGTMGTFVDFILNLLLTLFFFLFIVSGTGKLEKRMKRVLTVEHNRRAYTTMLNIQSQIQKYLFNRTLISLGTSLTGMFFMFVFGVDFIIIAGIFLFVLDFIPNIGSFIASMFPILICLLNYGLGWRSVGMAVSITLTQMLFSNILEPKLMGDRLNLTPIMVLISLIFWYWVWGIVGMVLAIPITSSINIIIKQMNEKNIVSAIISDT